MKFAIALDMTVEDLDNHHPKGFRKGYSDIAATLRKFGFERIQWTVYAAEDEDLTKLYQALEALKALRWFGPCVKSIRAFRMEQGSDLTVIMKA